MTYHGNSKVPFNQIWRVDPFPNAKCGSSKVSPLTAASLAVCSKSLLHSSYLEISGVVDANNFLKNKYFHDIPPITGLPFKLGIF